jgi:membrane protein DedA with SNARE-associated domain
MLSELLEYIGRLAIQVISYLGYFGVFVLMMLESMVAPVPSELVMPFAGFLAATGRFSFALVVLFSSLGSICGSLLSYYIGKYGGNKFVVHFGKYLLLDLEDLEKTEKWFAKKGDKTVLISRFIPVVRHLISIPAGIGKMDMKKFVVYTVVGATIWNTFLAYLGYILGQNWNEVKHYSEYITIPVAVLLLLSGAYFVYKHVKDKRKERKDTKDLLHLKIKKR